MPFLSQKIQQEMDKCKTYVHARESAVRGHAYMHTHVCVYSNFYKIFVFWPKKKNKIKFSYLLPISNIGIILVSEPAIWYYTHSYATYIYKKWSKKAKTKKSSEAYFQLFYNDWLIVSTKTQFKVARSFSVMLIPLYIKGRKFHRKEMNDRKGYRQMP